MKVRKALGERFGREVFFYSITLMPEEDSPETLKRFADRYKVDEMGPGWTFLTGRPRDIELLRRRLGFAYDDRKLDADRTNHIRLVLMGNEPYGWWGTAPGADMSANQITKLIEWLEPGSYGMQGRVTHASEGQQAEPSSSSKVSERPPWLRPLGDETPGGAAANNPPSSGRPPGEEASGARPWGWSLLEPGVLDVQAWDWLQQDLERMLDETKAHAPHRLSPEAFEAKFLGATVEFLEIDAEATKTFQTAVNKALDEIDRARADMLRRKAKIEPDLDETRALLESRAGWEEYGKAQHHAARHPLAVLQARPRHQLLRETMLKWLLRLDYGMNTAAQ